MVTGRSLVKVLDFGLAVRTLSDATETSTDPGGRVAGTASYMSPEQAQGKPVDSRSDVFSFGCVFYEMLTGRRAFQEDSGLPRCLPSCTTNRPLAACGAAGPVLRLVSKCLRSIRRPLQPWRRRQRCSRRDQGLRVARRRAVRVSSRRPAARFAADADRGCACALARWSYSWARFWPAARTLRRQRRVADYPAEAGSPVPRHIADGSCCVSHPTGRGRQPRYWLQQIGARDPLRSPRIRG